MNAWGRMHGGTEVQISQESTVALGDLFGGDTVLQPNGSQKEISQMFHEWNQALMVYFRTKEGKFLIAERSQVLQLANKKLIRVQSLKPGHKLQGLKGTLEVSEVSRVGFESDVSLLILDRDLSNIEDNLFIANGIVVGDYTLESRWEQLPQEIKE